MLQYMVSNSEELRKLIQYLEQYNSPHKVAIPEEPTKLLTSQSARSLSELPSTRLKPQLQPADTNLSNNEHDSSNALLTPLSGIEYRIGKLFLVVGRSSTPKSPAPPERLSVKDLVHAESRRRVSSETESESEVETSRKKTSVIFPSLRTKNIKMPEREGSNTDSDPESEVDAISTAPVHSERSWRIHRRRRKHTNRPENKSEPSSVSDSASDSLDEATTKPASKFRSLLGIRQDKQKNTTSENTYEISIASDSASDSPNKVKTRPARTLRGLLGRGRNKKKKASDRSSLSSGSIIIEE